MSDNRENQEDGNIKQEERNKVQNEDDLETYISDMKNLESDFSDLEDLDLEELKEMQEAIDKVKQSESITNLEIKDIDAQINGDKEYIAQREAMISDFSDLDGIDFDELKEMQEAIETVKTEESQANIEDGIQIQSPSEISSDLEERIKQELLERKIEKKKEVITPEKFLEYISQKRDKIWYHALHYLVFQTEDYLASKELLYDILKEETSKSPIDPIPEHQFYFGLGYILRLSLNDKQVIRYISGGKFKINIGIKILKEILEKAGDPISKRPILKEEEKQKMYKDFLKDNFLDI